MHAKEYVVSGFALIILIFFCLPIFALAYGIGRGISPNAIWLQVSVGLTSADVVNLLHSLLLPLTGAVIVFRSDYFVGFFGALILLVLCFGILAGLFVFVAISPKILGSLPRFVPYASDFTGVDKSVSSMISMMILLFLAKLGVDAPAPAASPPTPTSTSSPAPALPGGPAGPVGGGK